MRNYVFFPQFPHWDKGSEHFRPQNWILREKTTPMCDLYTPGIEFLAAIMGIFMLSMFSQQLSYCFFAKCSGIDVGI